MNIYLLTMFFRSESFVYCDDSSTLPSSDSATSDSAITSSSKDW